MTYDDETEVKRTDVVEVVDVTNRVKVSKKICLGILGFGFININAKVNETMLNATETESLCTELP